MTEDEAIGAVMEVCAELEPEEAAGLLAAALTIELLKLPPHERDVVLMAILGGFSRDLPGVKMTVERLQ